MQIKAVHMWHRDAVLIGKAALVMQGLKPPGQHLHDLDAVKEVEAYSRTRSIEREGIRVHRWRVPRRYVTEKYGMWVVEPEVSVLLLALDGDWAWVCEALRQGLVSPESCRASRSSLSWRFSRHQISSALADINLKSWSIPELEFGRLMRAVGITGVKPNQAVRAGDRRYILDKAFEAEKVAVEIDSRAIHGTIDGYENTMMRSANLDRSGWKILHTTPTMIRQHPQFVLDWLASHLHRRHRPRTTFPEHILRQTMASFPPDTRFSHREPLHRDPAPYRGHSCCPARGITDKTECCCPSRWHEPLCLSVSPRDLSAIRPRPIPHGFIMLD